MHYHLLTPTGQLTSRGDTELVQQEVKDGGTVVDVSHIHLHLGGTLPLSVTAAHVHPVYGNFLIVHPTSHQ